MAKMYLVQIFFYLPQKTDMHKELRLALPVPRKLHTILTLSILVTPK